MIPNYDESTGIHYGVISQHSIGPEALDEIYHGPHSTDLAYENWKEQLKAEIKSAAEDYMNSRQLERFVEHCMDWDDIGESYQGDEIDPRYEEAGYVVNKCLDADLFVIKSPFYTYAPECSPCVPNAGNLDSATKQQLAVDVALHEVFGEKGLLKSYCFGHDWFETGFAPYPVFKVGTEDELVKSDHPADIPAPLMEQWVEHHENNRHWKHEYESYVGESEFSQHVGELTHNKPLDYGPWLASRAEWAMREFNNDRSFNEVRACHVLDGNGNVVDARQISNPSSNEAVIVEACELGSCTKEEQKTPGHIAFWSVYGWDEGAHCIGDYDTKAEAEKAQELLNQMKATL